MDTNDLVYSRLKSYTIESNLIHKKALVLVNGLKSQISNLEGKEGVKKYLSNLISLLNIEISENGSNNQQNAEALMLTLAVTVKLAEQDIRKHRDSLLDIVTFFGDKPAFHQYCLLILESLLQTRTFEELQNISDPVCVAFELFTIENLVFSKNKEITVQLIKVFSKLFKVTGQQQSSLINSNNNTGVNKPQEKSKSRSIDSSDNTSIGSACKYSLVKMIVEKLKTYIKGMHSIEEEHENEDTVLNIVGSIDQPLTVTQTLGGFNSINNANSKLHCTGNSNINNIIISKSASTKVKRLTIPESESVLNFLVAVIQVFPLEFANDIVFDLNKLLKNTSSSNVLTQTLLVIDIAFSTKPLGTELCEDILNNLLDIEVLLQTESLLNISLITAYMKALTQAVLALTKKSLFLSIKYLPSVIAKLSQLIREENFDEEKLLTCEADLYSNAAIFKSSLGQSTDSALDTEKASSKHGKHGKLNLTECRHKAIDYVQSVFSNSMSNILNRVFSIPNIEQLAKEKASSKQQDKVTLLEDLDIEDSPNKNHNLDSTLEAISKELLALIDFELYEDLKTGHLVLYSFLDKLAPFPAFFRTHIDFIFQHFKEKYEGLVATMLSSSSTSQSPNHRHIETALTCSKVFLGKCFNLFPAAYLVQYMHLEVLSFDLESPNYTESSNVWLVPFIQKFLKHSGMQTIADYSEFFQDTIKEVLTKIQLLKADIQGSEQSNNTLLSSNPLTRLSRGSNQELSNNQDISLQNTALLNIENNNLMMIDEDDMDERFEDNSKTKYIKQLKVSRYELILSQVFSLLPLFSHLREKEDTRELEEVFAYIEVMNANCDACDASASNNSSNSSQSASGFSLFTRKVTFRVMTRVLDCVTKLGNKKLLDFFLREDYGIAFFSETVKNLTTIISNGSQHFGFKLNEESLQKSALNCLFEFCKVMDPKFVVKEISKQIEKFNAAVIANSIFTSNISKALITDDNDSNIAQLNLTLDNNIALTNNTNNTNPGVPKPLRKDSQCSGPGRFKELRQMALRVQLVIYLAKSIPLSTELFEILSDFHRNFFYEYLSALHRNNNPSKLFSKEDFKFVVKSFIELFSLLLEKASSPTQAIELFSELWNNQGLQVLSSKQKVHVFSSVFKLLMDEFNKQSNLSIEYLKENFNTVPIVIEIVSLTKDSNKKVRNSAYDLIAEISDFMTKHGLLEDWINILIAHLLSEEHIKSSVVNTLARVFWQERSQVKLLCQTAEVVLLLLNEKNNEVIKSVFLFMRVLVYVLGNRTEITVEQTLENNTSASSTTGVGCGSGSNQQSTLGGKLFPPNKQIKTYNLKNFARMFLPLVLQGRIPKDFKVKVRNLVKCLVLKLGLEEVKDIVGSENQALVSYINKHIIKKSEGFLTEEEVYYRNRENTGTNNTHNKQSTLGKNSDTSNNINNIMNSGNNNKSSLSKGVLSGKEQGQSKPSGTLGSSNSNSNNIDFDEAIFNENDNFAVDEEEDFINNEFSKQETKKSTPDKDAFLENIERWVIDEDDEEERKRKEELVSSKKKSKKEDFLDRLFNSSDVDFQNHFYMNPYAIGLSKQTKQGDGMRFQGDPETEGQDKLSPEKDNEVYFDKRKGKLVVKDFDDEKGKAHKQGFKKPSNIINSKSIDSLIEGKGIGKEANNKSTEKAKLIQNKTTNTMLNRKRENTLMREKNSNAGKDYDDENAKEEYGDEKPAIKGITQKSLRESTSRVKAMKANKGSLIDDIELLKQYHVPKKDLMALTLKQRSESREPKRSLKTGDTKKSHFIKFSGDEYKAKSGKGDTLLKGKYEPFAYIQLNPKAAIDKSTSKENIKLFEKIMYPQKKHK